MKILVIDNYDSFTYNLVQIIQELGVEQLDVIRNDKTTIEDIGHYDKYIISPGPGVPSEVPLLKQVIEEFGPTKSILGICLGHQAIGETFGCELVNLEEVYHGIATPVDIVKDDYLFANMPKQFTAGRYHSWAISSSNFSKELEVLATAENGAIMALRHRSYDIRGMQFHPESILTENGAQLLQNFVFGKQSKPNVALNNTQEQKINL
ncbi:MAG: anthranilate synthase component 2 [Polaribacter sp.]|jgi:anthranilate synthase component 2